MFAAIHSVIDTTEAVKVVSLRCLFGFVFKESLFLTDLTGDCQRHTGLRQGQRQVLRAPINP